MVGKDGIHITCVNATSVFDAAYQAIQEWSKLWWWMNEATLTVEADGNTWTVTSDRVMQWNIEKMAPRKNRGA